MRSTDSPIPELRERLDRYPAERYPIQHATAQFHLGTVLTDLGRLDEAASALQCAADLFGRTPLVHEHAKVLNTLGAALRLQQRLHEAAESFEEATKLFEQADAALDRGAAEFNLGLTRRDLGMTPDALNSFRRAQELLDVNKVPAQAAAACRELGTTLMLAGDLEGAVPELHRAVDWAEQCGDVAGMGASANALGLVQMSLDDPSAAIASFHAALAAHPRAIRPEPYAMVKANLALAYEQAGHHPRARLAARQAIRVKPAPPVGEQAQAVLDRLGDPSGDLLAVLAAEDRAAWAGIVREELGFWPEMDEDAAEAEAEAWVAGLCAAEDPAELAEAWLGAILEMPPEQMNRVITLAVQACSRLEAGDRRSFARLLQRAMPRFHSPQFLRLSDTFASVSAAVGLDEWDRTI